MIADDPDPYLWLEDIESDRSLGWVRERNAETTSALAENATFEALRAELQAAIESDEKIPYVGKQGEYVYNFWRDARNERGLWRRTPFTAFAAGGRDWEILLDLDQLSESDGIAWSWRGARCLYPEYRRCLVSLSPGGGDATVVREFDVASKTFVADGFSLPESKGGASWYDADTLIVGRDFGPGTLTASGYPRSAKLWRRGEPLAKAQVIFEGAEADVSAGAFRSLRKGFERTFYTRALTFYTDELYYVTKDGPVLIEKPADADASVEREWIVISLRSDWSVGGTTYPAGAVLIARFDEFLAGERDFQLLFEPDPRKTLDGFSFTKNHILVNELQDVRNRIFVLTERDGKWERAPLAGLPENASLAIGAVDDEESDDYWLQVTDYLTPSQLWLGSVGAAERTLIHELPSFFPVDGLVVKQQYATSADGTRIPYFIVHREGLALDGTHPTLLYGYGGFLVSLTPSYSSNVGIAWLARGGVYVVANIRGGGEFGPRWHQAALRENRYRAYDDFIAVAEDLVDRGVTRPAHLGIQGGSNGGLLMGNMLTRRPDLFGAIVCQVPLLDMQRYTKLLAGASWAAEYGDPDVPDQWAYLRRYSPYHNLSPGVAYPPVLFTTSTRDDRVHPGHARKMAARLLAEHDGVVRYYENTEGGHAGAGTGKQAAFVSALTYTFLWEQLGGSTAPIESAGR